MRDFREKIAPLRIGRLNQRQLLSSRPTLDLLLSGNRIRDCGVKLEPHEQFATVLFAEPVD
jgi:hypothetical protein